MFVGQNDLYLLRDDPKQERVARGGFDAIGTDAEKAPLVMEDYITYDEMKLSALMATCSPTQCINKGDRHNKAIRGKEGTYIK